ncbi:MAG: t4-like baseplate wedge, partial [Deltaproteobacteria bacterium]|nr:t4-like baseplate wedge [Deltaproteobacteria bacterium]
MSLITSVFPEWSDFDTAAFGNILLEMYAFVGDVVCYYLDNQARESRLVTATQRKNIIALARMFNYKLHGAQAATAEVELSLKSPPSADVVIPAGTIVRTKEITEPVDFQLLSSVTINADQDPPQASGVVEHSKTHVQLFDASGLAYQDIALDFTPYLDGSAVVIATNGVYTEQQSLLSSGPNDRHYTVLVDQSDRATVRFGNGANGEIPTGGISITYKTGGGADGNVEAGRIAVVDGSFQDIYGNHVQLSVTNPDPASGGTERQTIESARLLIPESLRALNRTVAREDFEIHARLVPGVARALMLTSNEDASIAENSGILYVVPQGGGAPTPALKNNVLRMVTETYPCT